MPHAGSTEDHIGTNGFETIEPMLEAHLDHPGAHLSDYGISAKLCWNNAAVYIDTLSAWQRERRGQPLETFRSLFAAACRVAAAKTPFVAACDTAKTTASVSPGEGSAVCATCFPAYRVAASAAHQPSRRHHH
jgi:ferric iron reductase protein FhuF